MYKNTIDPSFVVLHLILIHLLYQNLFSMKATLFGLISSLAALSLAAPCPDDGSQEALSFAYMVRS